MFYVRKKLHCTFPLLCICISSFIGYKTPKTPVIAFQFRQDSGVSSQHFKWTLKKKCQQLRTGFLWLPKGGASVKHDPFYLLPSRYIELAQPPLKNEISLPIIMIFLYLNLTDFLHCRSSKTKPLSLTLIFPLSPPPPFEANIHVLLSTSN